jgi:DNA-binding CsgD family transcriptional regulator
MAHREIGMRPRPHRAETESAADAGTRRAPIRADVVSGQLLGLFAAKDLDTLIDTALAMLPSVVGCDFATAFYRSGGDGLLKARDSRGRRYGVEFMRRHIELNPAIPLALANRGVKVLATRMGLPRSNKELRGTAFYREIMKPLGWRHSVALCFWGDPPAELPVFVISADRSERQSDFSDREVAALTGFHPFLDCAVNHLNEREAATTMHDSMAMAMRDGTPGFAILDRDLLLVQGNPIARRLCAAWSEDALTEAEKSSATWHLPPVLQTTCQELYHEWQSLLRADPDAAGIHRDRRVVHPRVPGLTARITLVCPNAAGLAAPTFVLELDRRVHGVTLDMADGSVPVLEKMTAAERAVAMVLADGFSNQEIADRLGKTVDAVKFLLHRIYRKTGVPSRAALVAVLRARPNRRSRKSALKIG